MPLMSGSQIMILINLILYDKLSLLNHILQIINLIQGLVLDQQNMHFLANVLLYIKLLKS